MALTYGQKLDNLFNAIVDDIMSMSDEQLLAEAEAEGDIELAAQTGRGIIDQAMALHNKNIKGAAK